VKIESVLIIEDDDDIREVAALTLETVGGYEVLCVDNGYAGVDAAAARQPSVILLDVMMPELDGPSTFALLRRREETRDIPVIFMTAKAGADQRRLRELGARGVITKPFDPMTLRFEVEQILGACS
jgi:CheY-like chemotaxis protein